MTDETNEASAEPREPVQVPDNGAYQVGPPRQERGAQVHLTGVARAAARGAVGGSIEHNTLAKDKEIREGRAAPGTTPDGSTHDGRLPADTLDGADQEAYGAPAQGEGTEGFRPGDDKVMEAKAEAAKDRAKAKGKDAH